MRIATAFADVIYSLVISPIEIQKTEYYCIHKRFAGIKSFMSANLTA